MEFPINGMHPRDLLLSYSTAITIKTFFVAATRRAIRVPYSLDVALLCLPNSGFAAHRFVVPESKLGPA